MNVNGTAHMANGENDAIPFDEKGRVLVSRSAQVHRLSLEESCNASVGISAFAAFARLPHGLSKINTFDWVKINTSFQFIPKRHLKERRDVIAVKGKWSIWKTDFSFSSLPPFAPPLTLGRLCV
jgi:hypothetical protein